MRFTFLIVLLAVVAVAFGVGSFVENVKAKKELKEEKKKEEHNAQVDQNTVNVIDEINSGDIDHDFNAGIDQLHELSQKRRS